MKKLCVRFEDVEYLGQAEGAEIVMESKVGTVFKDEDEILIVQQEQCIVLTLA